VGLVYTRINVQGLYVSYIIPDCMFSSAFRYHLISMISNLGGTNVYGLLSLIAKQIYTDSCVQTRCPQNKLLSGVHCC
jgi:hypothetical protein